MDMCVEQTHELRPEMRSNERPMRYTDTRTDEQVCWAVEGLLGPWFTVG